jgi:ribosome-binding factor A
MGRHSSGGRSVRQLRIGEEIRHALAGILARDEVHDLVLEGCAITVSEVRVSPDVRQATAFVVPLAGANQEAVVSALNRHASYLRGRLGKSVYLKHVPKLKFDLDRTFDEADKITDLLTKSGLGVSGGDTRD